MNKVPFTLAQAEVGQVITRDNKVVTRLVYFEEVKYFPIRYCVKGRIRKATSEGKDSCNSAYDLYVDLRGEVMKGLLVKIEVQGGKKQEAMEEVLAENDRLTKEVKKFMISHEKLDSKDTES